MPGPSGSATSSARLGLLKPVPIEFDEVAKPHYPPVKNWREVNVMTIAYGHGISVTPLHVDHRGLGDRQWRHPASADAAQGAGRREPRPASA